MQTPTLYDTSEMIDYFYDLTKNVWSIIQFKPKTYFNTYIYKQDTSIETIYSGMSGKDNTNLLEERTTTYKVDNGTLYYIYFDSENAVMSKNDHLHTYALVTNDSRGLDYYGQFKNRFPNCLNTLWFSYMQSDTGFDWHVDGSMSRYHQVLINDGITPSFSTADSELYFTPDTAFIEDVSKPHRVLPCTGERLHIIGSIKNESLVF